MPPSMSAHAYEAPDLTKDDLTDEAIEILYDIVRRAQSSSDKSSRAVFTAYEEVLDEQGRSPSDDVILHRFLFRMQKNRRNGESLIQRFKRVLHESFGIDVEIDEEGEGVEVTTNLDVTRNRTQNEQQRQSRRGSFDSYFDGTADKVAGVEYEDLPIRPRRASRSGALQSEYASRRQARSDTEAYSYQPSQLPIRNRMNGNTHRPSTSGSYQPNRKRSTSVSSHGSLQIRRDGHTRISQVVDDDADDSDYTDRTTSLDLSHVQVPGLNAPIPNNGHAVSHEQYVPVQWQPSDTRLMDEAETFEQQRLHRVTRDCIQRWRSGTQEKLLARDSMEQLANAHDRKILLKLSFEQLRDTARIRHSGRETDRFFTRLESRAEKARNLFLLTKAFTHWAKSAEDEVQRTSVARRHILRTRFFNGWRDITAVNELKIQHFILVKFLRLWRGRAAIVREGGLLAVIVYEENLVHRVYKEWFFKFCAIAAPAWRNDRTRRIMLQRWAEIIKVLKERENWVTDRQDRTVLRKMLQTWQARTKMIQSRQPQAESFRKSAQLSTALRALQKQAQLMPLLQQFRSRIDRRVTKTAFQAWQGESQLARQVRNIDRLRILRNTWTAWNDRLRIKALEDRINDRLVVECLYKWTLASRASLLQRVHERQLKSSALLTLVTKTNQRINAITAAERSFAQFKRGQLLRTYLRRLEALTTERRAEQFAVTTAYQQEVKRRILNRLKERQEHLQQLKQWSADARFYVLSKRTLKTWSEATQHSRRNRRRESYAQVRRTVKLNSVRRLFDSWRDKADKIAVQKQLAIDMYQNCHYQSTGVILRQWRDRTVTQQRQETQAINVYNFKAEARYFHTWSSRMDSFRALESQAVALHQESIEVAATSALKKLGWRLWNIQRQEKNAQALHERNFEKQVRAMMRFWLEQTGLKLANRPDSPTPTRRSRGRRRDRDNEVNRQSRNLEQEDGVPDGAGEEFHQLGPWAAFDETVLDVKHDLDLSLAITPDHPSAINPYALPLTSSRLLPQPQPSSLLRPSVMRPNTYPPPSSAIRPPSQTIPKYIEEIDEDFADPSTFWSGTPIPPSTATSKPGYLKTPSKRSVMRAKRPELPASPEKQAILPFRRPIGLDGGRSILERERGREIMSAPHIQTSRNVDFSTTGGVTSFGRRLQQGGFGHSVAGTTSAITRNKERNGKEKARVGFADVSEMG